MAAGRGAGCRGTYSAPARAAGGSQTAAILGVRGSCPRGAHRAGGAELRCAHASGLAAAAGSGCSRLGLARGVGFGCWPGWAKQATGCCAGWAKALAGQAGPRPRTSGLALWAVWLSYFPFSFSNSLSIYSSIIFTSKSS